ncbi:hypothetical protein Vretifemale_13726 [Volvox reticuliferus]|uniref:Retrotransposon gag domain-containing protein n=2 Tax=Volvox reticuliferus TaxID=1737510 RepID=A0A8J4CR87_9CHLO|nr:hypothetical protein Vretifemale_13726 [Volvox reticuliferus]
MLKLAIPTPKLNIDEKSDVKTTPVCVRAFVRDVVKLFALVAWGQIDEARCLFLSQALSGQAKMWFDSWSLATKEYTSNHVIVQLIQRFAPQIQSLEEEARLKLYQLMYCMTPGESIAAYRSCFEALITDIPSITEGELLFAFRQGLTESLHAACTVDNLNQPFKKYSDLVQHALGEERRIVATRQARAAIRSNAVAAQSVEGDVEMVNAAGPSTSRPPHGAPTAALAVNHPEMKKKGRPQQHKLRGQSAATHDDLAPTKFYDVNDRNIPYGVYVKRRAARVCLCCRSKDHHYNECPRRPQHRPPVAGGDPAVGPIIQ